MVFETQVKSGQTIGLRRQIRIGEAICSLKADLHDASFFQLLHTNIAN